MTEYLFQGPREMNPFIACGKWRSPGAKKGRLMHMNWPLECIWRGRKYRDAQ